MVAAQLESWESISTVVVVVVAFAFAVDAATDVDVFLI